jgi:MFS family permease
LSRARIVARPGFNRWLVPPAALAIHLCIGMAYGLSVFWLPLTRAIGIAKPVVCDADMGIITILTTTACDWRLSDLSVIFSLAIVVLGASAALWGGWLERAGPRKAGFVAALCWSVGLLLTALGIYLHQLWLMWLGGGVVGGVGLGLGYISPVSTLIKWFPDRRGMATGMAIMGFGGGAMIGMPLADILMRHFSSPTGVGVWQTFAVLGLIYFVFMTAGAFAYRVPPADWLPPGFAMPARNRGMISHGQVHLRDAHKTPQFWLVWLVLMLNVSAGIAVLAVASPMLQEIFGGTLLGQPEVTFSALDAGQKARIATMAAAFGGLISLFNIGGRFFWASFSDRIGRKPTFGVIFLLGIVLYAAAPSVAHAGMVPVFVLIFCVILSMYGGGFATVPAYLADLFGTQFVGAIHGRLLTAWSTAGILGPVLITQIRNVAISRGLSGTALYDTTLYVMAGLLALGFLCNLAIRPVAPKWFMPAAALASVQGETVATPAEQSGAIGTGGITGLAILAWLAVGLPIAWGVWITLTKAAGLF